MDLIFTFITIFFPLFVVIDPFGTMVLFMTMTSEYSAGEQKVAAKDSFVYGTIILVFFAITGSTILYFMGISLSAIQIAGGIILLIMGIEMVREGDRPKSTGKSFNNPDLGIVPFATPLLAGPGAISLVIILSRVGIFQAFITIISIVIIFVMVFILFSYSRKISRAIGDKPMKAITRIFGLFVAGFAIQFILDAVLTITGI